MMKKLRFALLGSLSFGLFSGAAVMAFAQADTGKLHIITSILNIF
ncbi:hypothetical protein [Viridibacillus sp. FSL H7-0596]|nr:hypothetical protein [Viridibacillus sp. FSL H7-0596]